MIQTGGLHINQERVHTETYYYSEKLTRKLEILRLAKATVVEAPSGYGKTTAIRHYMDQHLPPGTPVYWFTATDEEPAAGYKRLCREIARIDPQAGDSLLKAGLPSSATIGEACEALRCLHCKDEAFIVLDNFQLLIDVLPLSFTCALLDHGGEKLHVVLLTQLVRRNLIPFMAGHGVPHITEAALRFSAAGIRQYYAAAGQPISEKDAAQIEHNTSGWVAAVYLHLCALRERGSYSGAPGILTLMEHLVWDTLTERQQTFLLHISPFNMVTLQEACVLSGYDILPDDTLDALSIPFIRFEPTQRCYELHGILSQLLVKKRAERGAAFERECLLRAGDYCRDRQRIAEAFSFYAQAQDYEGMLSLDFSNIILEDIGGRRFSEYALQIVQHCPPDIKRKHILSMLRIAWTLLLVGSNDEFGGLMDELHVILEGGGDDNTRLLGEWMLLHSYRSFPDLAVMTGVLEKAERLFDGKCSRVILPSAPWCFGDFFPFHVFHLTPGEAEREANDLERYITVYSKLTNGHGSGGDALFRAELAFYRGDTSNAEIFAYKAAYLAESNEQGVVLLGAAHLLAEIALQKADAIGWQNAIVSMERAASFAWQNNFVTRALADITRGNLFFELQNPARIAGWLKNADFSEEHILPFMINSALYVHFSYLLQQGEYLQLLGKMQAIVALGLVKESFSQILMDLNMAVCYLQTGNREKAAVFIEHSIEAALPDGLTYLFVGYSTMMDGLLDQIMQRKYPQLLNKFIEVKERFKIGWDFLHNAMFRNELPADLTAREYEVAKLAAEGLRNSEIAERLTVTENTVRFHLRAVFQKLDIDRRAKLVDKLK